MMGWRIEAVLEPWTKSSIYKGIDRRQQVDEMRLGQWPGQGPIAYAGRMESWTPSEDWWARHTSQDLVYTVTFRFSSPAVVDQIWASASRTRRRDGDVILDGGAYLERVGPRDIEAGSGGEDGLDSLEFCINDLLFAETVAVAPGEKPKIVREVRELVEDEDQ